MCSGSDLRNSNCRLTRFGPAWTRRTLNISSCFLRWQDILDSPSNPLKSILVVSLHRVDKVGIPPPISTFVSSRSTVVPVERFGAGGVTSFLQECFSWDETEPSMSSLVDFLFTETEGPSISTSPIRTSFRRLTLLCPIFHRQSFLFEIDRDFPRTFSSFTHHLNVGG